MIKVVTYSLFIICIFVLLIMFGNYNYDYTSISGEKTYITKDIRFIDLDYEILFKCSTICEGFPCKAMYVKVNFKYLNDFVEAINQKDGSTIFNAYINGINIKRILNEDDSDFYIRIGFHPNCNLKLNSNMTIITTGDKTSSCVLASGYTDECSMPFMHILYKNKYDEYFKIFKEDDILLKVEVKINKTN